MLPSCPRFRHWTFNKPKLGARPRIRRDRVPLGRAPRRIVEYACGALGRAPCIHARLRRLATKPGEKCGLGVYRILIFLQLFEYLQGLYGIVAFLC